MSNKYIGKKQYKISEDYFFPDDYVIFEVDFGNKILYEVIKQMAIFHGLEFNEDNFIKCLQECLELISHLAYSYCTSEMYGRKYMGCIEDYIAQTEGFPDVDGSSGITLTDLEFSARLDPCDFNIEEVTNN